MIPPKSESPYVSASRTGLITVLQGPLQLKNPPGGWLEAAAVAHNREQHAANGNIDSVKETDICLNDILSWCQKGMWEGETILECPKTCKELDLKLAAERNFNYNYFARNSNCSNAVPVNCGTLHAFFCNAHEIIKEDASQKDDISLHQLFSNDDEIIKEAFQDGDTSENTCFVAEPVSGMITENDEIGILEFPVSFSNKTPSTKQQWIAIRLDPNITYGSMEFRSLYHDSNFGCSDYRSYPSNLNFSEMAGLSAIVKKAQERATDFRSMALKIALYDELRERRLVQPTGVDWAWSPPTLPKTNICFPHHLKLNYSAIFVDVHHIEYAMRNGGKIRVGESEKNIYWDLNLKDTMVIGLPEDYSGRDLDVWILAHLTYPLAWVLDTFDISDVAMVKKKQVFNRTAGLVDIFNYSNKIIFVNGCTKRSYVNICKTKYRVDYKHDDTDIKIYNINKDIQNVLVDALRGKVSLREKLSEYVKPFIIGGIDWVEIDLLATLCVVRWHAKVEGITERGRTNYVGAPPNILRALGTLPYVELNELPDKGYEDKSSVSSFDQCFVRQLEAKIKPGFTLGTWSNMTELAITFGLGTYKMPNTMPQDLIQKRIHNGGLDRLKRASFARVGLESWKLAMGITDTIAFPKGFDIDMDVDLESWHDYIDKGSTGKTVQYLLNLLFSNLYNASWSMNLYNYHSGISQTGLRCPSSFYRFQSNVKWEENMFDNSSKSKSSHYRRDTTPDSNFQNKFIQVGERCHNQRVWSSLLKLDLTKNQEEYTAWDLSYRNYGYFINDSTNLYSFVVDSSHGGILAASLDPRVFYAATFEAFGRGNTILLKGPCTYDSLGVSQD
ncbi:uncharacterized protein [Prorops nasuta]|uniref:uncharacterized protein isoform X2 n=1 Tax=Prorops nasuta TaxID=863751 RepID=UPI0034CF0795